LPWLLTAVPVVEEYGESGGDAGAGLVFIPSAEDVVCQWRIDVVGRTLPVRWSPVATWASSCLTVPAAATPTAEPGAAAMAKPAASATRCRRTLAPLIFTPRRPADSTEVTRGAGSAIGTRSSAVSENTAWGYSTTSNGKANDARHSKPLYDSTWEPLA
jgi:hypothetical protein